MTSEAEFLPPPPIESLASSFNLAWNRLLQIGVNQQAESITPSPLCLSNRKNEGLLLKDALSGIPKRHQWLQAPISARKALALLPPFVGYRLPTPRQAASLGCPTSETEGTVLGWPCLSRETPLPKMLTSACFIFHPRRVRQQLGWEVRCGWPFSHPPEPTILNRR